MEICKLMCIRIHTASSVGSLPTMQLLTAAKLSRPETMENLSREFWKRIYRTVRFSSSNFLVFYVVIYGN